MSMKYKPGRGFLLFLVRNMILYFLLLNAYSHLKRELDIVFLSSVFVLAVLIAVWTERGRLRFLPALLLILLIPLGLRFLFFQVFGLQRSLSPGPETDFLYFYFDKDFFPGLLPFLIIWLFNFCALRFPVFIYLETGFNALFLLVIFWSEAGYRITLYPHPTLFAAALLSFLLCEILVIMLGRLPDTRIRAAEDTPVSWKKEARSFLSFMWLIVPLLFILLFFLLSRFNQGAVRLGGGLMKPTLFRFDFSEFIRLESEIEMSDDLVLLFRKEGPAERILLRRYILSGFDKRRGFYHVRKKGLEDLPVTVSDMAEEIQDPDYLARADVRQEYFFVNFDPTSLIGMNYPVKVTPLKNWDSSSFLRIYRVHSRVSQAGPFELEDIDSDGLTPGQHRHYTFYGNDEEIEKLAEEITAWSGSESYYAKVLLIRDYLKTNYFYSLKPGLAADGDQLSHFLFKSQKGYCSYFAFAMTLLCRSLGIPARVAVGFYVDPETEVLNFYEVRAYQAHAWVEVYFSDYGWIEFDPSSTEIAPGEEFILQFGFDFEHLSRLIEEILKNQDQLEEEKHEQLAVRKKIFLWGGELVKALSFVVGIWYITLPVLYLLTISIIKLHTYILFIFHSSERKKVKYLFRFSLVRAYGLGLIRRPEESIMEYSEKLDLEYSLNLRPWTEYYLKAVFDSSFPDQDYAQALKAYYRFLSSFKETYPLILRILGFLNPMHSLMRRA